MSTVPMNVLVASVLPIRPGDFLFVLCPSFFSGCRLVAVRREDDRFAAGGILERFVDGWRDVDGGPTINGWDGLVGAAVDGTMTTSLGDDAESKTAAGGTATRRNDLPIEATWQTRDVAACCTRDVFLMRERHP